MGLLSLLSQGLSRGGGGCGCRGLLFHRFGQSWPTTVRGLAGSRGASTTGWRPDSEVTSLACFPPVAGHSPYPLAWLLSPTATLLCPPPAPTLRRQLVQPLGTVPLDSRHTVPSADPDDLTPQILRPPLPCLSPRWLAYPRLTGSPAPTPGEAPGEQRKESDHQGPKALLSWCASQGPSRGASRCPRNPGPRMVPEGNTTEAQMRVSSGQALGPVEGLAVGK